MEAMEKHGLLRLVITLQLFWHPHRRILVAVHFDDFLAAAHIAPIRSGWTAA